MLMTAAIQVASRVELQGNAEAGALAANGCICMRMLRRCCPQDLNSSGIGVFGHHAKPPSHRYHGMVPGMGSPFLHFVSAIQQPVDEQHGTLHYPILYRVYKCFAFCVVDLMSVPPPPSRGKGSEGRAANGDRPVGTASCRRDHHTMVSCQNPLLPVALVWPTSKNTTVTQGGIGVGEGGPSSASSCCLARQCRRVDAS